MLANYLILNTLNSFNTLYIGEQEMNKNHKLSEQEILLEQYKLYVEMADRISARRAQTNKFFIALLTALLAILSLTSDKSLFTTYQIPVCFIVSFLGISLNILWFVNILSYKQLNTGKFQVIHEMEKSLPFSCYDEEWKKIGEGKDNNKYLPLTRIEQFVPVLLVIPYVLLLIYSFFNLIN